MRGNYLLPCLDNVYRDLCSHAMEKGLDNRRGSGAKDI